VRDFPAGRAKVRKAHFALCVCISGKHRTSEQAQNRVEEISSHALTFPPFPLRLTVCRVLLLIRRRQITTQQFKRVVIPRSHATRNLLSLSVTDPKSPPLCPASHLPPSRRPFDPAASPPNPVRRSLAHLHWTGHHPPGRHPLAHRSSGTPGAGAPAARASPIPAAQSAPPPKLPPVPSAQFPRPRPTPPAPTARIPSSSATPPNPPTRIASGNLSTCDTKSAARPLLCAPPS